ncbi:MAG: sensor domain-containing diguanylate cyclase [Photobacterium frigidiphilum]|uniref:sensor domain-containing diguanylate cyclase n=1 Tax=Photobacterium frigidiphilum TaxID=264736 RepID=UPI0030016958
MSDKDHYLESELYDLVKKEQSIFDFLHEGSLDGIWYWDLQNIENEWMSPRFWELLGHSPEEKQHLASEWQDLIDPADLQLAIVNFNKHCEDPKHLYDQVVRYKHKDGSSVWVRCRGVAIREQSGKPIRMLGAHTDITQLKLAEQKIAEQQAELIRLNNELKALAATDALTSLSNRRFFDEQLTYLVNSALRNKQPLSLIMLDIDKFKECNDMYGHFEGDCILKTVSSILSASARETDIVARIGGEEFAIILPACNKLDSEIACERLYYTIQNHNWSKRKVTISFGVATMSGNENFKANSTPWGNIIIDADKALYFSKRNGRDQINHFDDIHKS